MSFSTKFFMGGDARIISSFLIAERYSIPERENQLPAILWY